MKDNVEPEDNKAVEEPANERLSSESLTFDLSSDRATLLTAQYPQGTSAKGYTFGADGKSGVAGRLEKAEKDIEKMYFHNNPEGFKHWQEHFAPTKQKMIADAYQYEVAQVIHGAKEDNDLQLEGEFTAIREGYDMTNVAAFFTTGALMEEITDDYNTQMKDLKREEDDFPADTSTPEGAKLAEERAKIKASAAAKEVKDIKSAQSLYDSKIEIARKHTDKFLARKHREQYEHAKNVLGRSHEASVAFANVQMNKHVKKLLQDMVATNPECAKSILKWLARPNATSIQEVDKDGNAVVGKDNKPTYKKNVYNPLGRWCLSDGEVAELMQSAEKQLAAYENLSKLRLTIEQAKHDLQQKKLEQTVNAWKGNARLKIARGDLSMSPNPDDMLSKFIPDIEMFQKAGYEKTDELISSITSACNSYFKLRDETGKRYDSMQKSARQAYFAKRIQDYKDSEADNVAMTYLLPDGRIGVNKSVDRRAAIVAFIDKALRDDTLESSVKAIYGEEKKRLQDERVERNAEALGLLAERCGWRLPSEQTKKVINYRTGMYTDVEGMPSRQTGDMLLFNEKGAPVIGNDMTATWTDPEDPNLTVSLGASEVRDLFRRTMNILDSTPEDDLAVMKDAKAGSKSRVEVAFLNACRTAAREKNSNNVYSSLAGAIRTMDNALFSPSVRTSTRRLGYMQSNAFIPPVVKKKTDDAKSAKK